MPVRHGVAEAPDSSETSRGLPFHDWWPEILFVVVAIAAAMWGGGEWLDPVGDTGFSWSLAHRLAQGELLYRDVYLAYGPLSPYLLGLGARLAGLSAVSVLLANWIAAVAAGLLLLRCARPFLSPFERVSLTGVMLAGSIFAPGAGRLVSPYYPGVVHALALSLIALLLLGPGGFRTGVRASAAGLLAGLAFCAKQEIGAALLLALLLSLLLRPREAVSTGVRVLAGFAAVIGLAALLVFSSASLDSLRERSHLWPLDPTPPTGLNRIYGLVAGTEHPGWPFAFREAAWGLLCGLVLISCVGMLLARERTLSRWVPVLSLGAALGLWWAAEDFMFRPVSAPIILSMTVSFLVSLLALLRRQLPGRDFLVAFGAFAGLAGIRTAFSPLLSGHFDGPGHFASSLSWLLFLCVLVPPLLSPGAKAAGFTRGIIAVVVLLVSWSGAGRGILTLRAPAKEAVHTREGRVFLERENAAFFQLLGRRLKAGEKALVLPEINAVDALFGVRSVSPLLGHLPGWLDEKVEREVIRRFERDPPDVVVIFTRPTLEYGAAPFGQGFGRLLAEWIERRYHPVEAVKGGAIYRR